MTISGEYIMWETAGTFKKAYPGRECGWVEVTTFGDKERQYIPGLPTGKPPQQKCEFCGSHCVDARGNCGACGAPL